MEKISSILPSNPRLTSVDSEDAQPARPGAPTLGRKEGVTSVRDRVSLSSQAKDIAAKETVLTGREKEASRAKMVAEINRKFFETRVKPVVVEPPTIKSEEIEESLPENIEMPMRQNEREEVISQYEAPVQDQPRLSIEA